MHLAVIDFGHHRVAAWIYRLDCVHRDRYDRKHNYPYGDMCTRVLSIAGFTKANVGWLLCAKTLYVSKW